MEKRIKDRYNDKILQEAMRRYGIAPKHIQLLDGFESYLYEFERGQGEYILRIGHSLRRSVPMIQGEVNWINYLSEGGVSVARAIQSQNDRLVELIDDGQGGQFLATAFVKAGILKKPTGIRAFTKRTARCWAGCMRSPKNTYPLPPRGGLTGTIPS